MTQPLCSVLLCTLGRRDLLLMAIESYLSQDWENKELVIVASGELVYDLVEDIPNISYIQSGAKNLSQKRNEGIREARGEFICHFDDDDWSGTGRVTHQITQLLQNPGIDIAGYGKAYWFDYVDHMASRIDACVWGATMCYRRSFGLAHPWNESIALGEDGSFQSPAAGRILTMDAGNRFVATMHSGNARRVACGKCPQWPYVPVSDLPEGFRKYIA
jgi:glycosyltransferase involved in cell wall biosynthesis